MKIIAEDRLETDVQYRFAYLSEFVGFSPEDVAAIHRAAGQLLPLVPQIVDAVYDKLFSYDATKRHFVPRQFGYVGTIPESVHSLTQDHEMIQFRKSHLARYLDTLLTKPYDEKMAGYLDFVGKMHTPQAGSKELEVPLVQMNALMGFLSTLLLNAIQNVGFERTQEVRTIMAMNKLLWLQNDLIVRHY